MQKGPYFVTIMRLGGWRQQPPEIPPKFAGNCKFNPASKRFTIEGNFYMVDIAGIFECLARQRSRLLNPFWELRMEGARENATAFAIVPSRFAIQRELCLTNSEEQVVNPEHSPQFWTVKDDQKVSISSLPEGQLCRISNQLLVSNDSQLDVNTTDRVLVEGVEIEWSNALPSPISVLDANLCFTAQSQRHDEQGYRNLVAFIAKEGAPNKFGVAKDVEGWGDSNSASVFLLDTESANSLGPDENNEVGDVLLVPVFSAQSPEANLVRTLVDGIASIQ